LGRARNISGFEGSQAVLPRPSGIGNEHDRNHEECPEDGILHSHRRENLKSYMTEINFV
jgi:hypothetical protein